MRYGNSRIVHKVLPPNNTARSHLRGFGDKVGQKFAFFALIFPGCAKPTRNLLYSQTVFASTVGIECSILP